MNLNNDHNVYILGAGFSREAGLPLISDFLVEMRDSHEWLQNEGRDREAKAVERVLDFRLNAASAAYWVNMELENIEELFSLASAGTGKMDDEVRLAIAATLEFTRAKGAKETQLYVYGESKVFLGPSENGRPTRCPPWAKFDDSPTTTKGRRKEELGPFKLGRYDYYAARLLGMFGNGSPKGLNSLSALTTILCWKIRCGRSDFVFATGSNRGP